MHRWQMALWAGLLVSAGVLSPIAQAGWDAGFSRRDVTPTKALRLSGYGSRTVPSEGTETPLQLRCFALRSANGDERGPVHALIAVDTIGFPAALTSEVLERVQAQYGISRERFVISCSHSHTSPHIARGLENLFSTPTTDEEKANLIEYTDFIRDECVLAVGEAIQNLAPARLSHAVGEVNFAQNRRVIENGLWKGFGVNPDGAVDHTLPVLKVTDASGEKLRGLLFNYACHCTTFGGEHNQVNGDWAGYASRGIEEAHPGTFALCTIGCGADQNPPRDSKRDLEYAQAEGKEIVEEVGEMLTRNWREIDAAPTARFGFAGLPIDRPSVDDLKKALQSSQPQVRRHAEVMLETKDRMGRLPESYPMPVQTWRFGDQFAMFFLGGEVCVEYALRIKKELGDQTWVNAYCNDVFAYVAPERMRAEGGYEVDFSMIYYLQPGRWSTGTEDVILKRVHELYEGKNLAMALEPQDALQTFQVPQGFRLELVAAEPLIRDPINFAIGPDGKLWVVEMGDYPRGLHGQGPADGIRHEPWDGQPGGRIKVLVDQDGDGTYDKAEIFADHLSFPTGVFPWRDGVLASGAPDILFLKDTDGDLKADVSEVLYSGFEISNPQHRINGFEYALDGTLHLASGVSSGNVTSTKTGETVNMSGRDLRIQPDTGFMEPVSGRSQYGRCRDDFGNWYGNTNSEPLFHYIIEDADLRRNPHVPSPSPRIFLTEPKNAPPVYPASRTADRFNDLYAANRFTSACAPFVYRDVSFIYGQVSPVIEELAQSVFICEPVHNLISRVVVRYPGIVPEGRRAAGEEQGEFLASTDPWFRPVRMLTGPDGSIWVCDMYRAVIEHPEWIPEAWQARIDLYAGEDRGRIYRLVPDSVKAEHLLPKWPSEMDDVELVRELARPNGWRRDTAQRLLIERGVTDGSVAYRTLLDQLREEQVVPCRIQQMWTAHLLNPEFHKASLRRENVLRSQHPLAVRQALRVFDLEPDPIFKWQPHMLASHEDLAVRYELALRAGDASLPVRKGLLAILQAKNCDDPWMRAAILSSASGVASELIQPLFRDTDPSPGRTALAEGLIATALGEDPQGNAAVVLAVVTASADGEVSPWQLEASHAVLTALHRQQLTLEKLISADGQLKNNAKQLRSLFREARRIAEDANANVSLRAVSIGLLGQEPQQRDYDKQILTNLMTATTPPELQTAAIITTARLGDTERLVAALRTLSPQPQATAQTSLLSLPGGKQAVIDALSSERLSPGDLSPAVLQTLAKEPGAAGLLVAANPDRARVIEEFASASSLTANPQRGRELFQKHCATCHRHIDVGTDLGPKLAALQDKSPEFLLTAILDPNRSVDSRYRSWNAALRDGRVLAGMILEETATSLTFAGSDGRPQTILRNELETLQVSRNSFMPEGLEKTVQPQDVADIMAFVRLD